MPPQRGDCVFELVADVELVGVEEQEDEVAPRGKPRARLRAGVWMDCVLLGAVRYSLKKFPRRDY